MVIDFANFYWRFVQGFSKITTLLTLLLKVIELSNLSPKAFGVDKNEFVKLDSRANKIIVNLSKNKKSKNLTYILNIRTTGKLNFLTSDAKKTFNYLQLEFIKAPIL